MTVKIISEKPVRTKRVVCNKCCYELEYTGVDVQVLGGYCMGEYDVSSYIICPECKERITVSAWR